MAISLSLEVTPLRKLLNVLYVTSPDSFLTRDGENVVVKVDGEDRFRAPIHNLEGIVAFGYCGASPAVMQLCVDRGVGLTFVTEYGRFLARVSGKVSGNVLLRRRQYRVADSHEEAALIVSSFVIGKIANSRTVLMRAIRDHETSIDAETVSEAVYRLTDLIKQVSDEPSIGAIRGIEGAAASIYFGVLDHLILAEKEDFFFSGRNRRPPRDNVNALLSFLYTLLMHDVQSALETVGLDPQVGLLHRDRSGRPSLALDLMEELRACLADRLALTLINRRQISGKGFRQMESGGVIMDDDTRKLVISAWQKRKQEQVMHPFLNERIEIGLIPYSQAMLLARHLRGDIDGYPPFFWK